MWLGSHKKEVHELIQIAEIETNYLGSGWKGGMRQSQHQRTSKVDL
jgi:hypothetical protein